MREIEIDHAESDVEASSRRPAQGRPPRPRYGRKFWTSAAQIAGATTIAVVAMLTYQDMVIILSAIAAGFGSHAVHNITQGRLDGRSNTTNSVGGDDASD